MASEPMDIYEALGVQRIINVMGTSTVLGGSLWSETVLAAVEQASQSYIRMADLIDKAGHAVASMVGAEAALITTGCFSALAQSAAALMSGDEPKRIARIPDTSDFARQFLIQQRMRYSYDRAIAAAGGQLQEVGGPAGTTAQQLQEAVDRSTVGILFPVHLAGEEGTVPLDDVMSIAHGAGCPVIVDAAFQVYPVQHMKDLASSDADLICFSAKYVGGPNNIAFLCGSASRIAAVASHNFMAFEQEGGHAFGRGYKLDPRDIVAGVVALQEWIVRDHDTRVREMERLAAVVEQGLAGVDGVRLERQRPSAGMHPWVELKVHVDETVHGGGADVIARSLAEGEPIIQAEAASGAVLIQTGMFSEKEAEVVARRLAEELRG